MKRAKKPYFSVVIPALNEEKFVPNLLSDLAKQIYSDFEVIVVDGKSDDKTVEKSEKFLEKMQLRILVAEKRNVSYQRNWGAQHAKGKWVVFMDADDRLPDNFLLGVRYQLTKNPSVDCFSTRLSAGTSNKLDRLLSNGVNLAVELQNSMGTPTGIAALLGCKTEIFLQHPFDEKQHFLEDGFFLKEITSNGYTYHIFPEPKFILSLRRFKKEGNLKLLQTAFKYQLHYLRGGDFTKPLQAKDYPMLGGMYYAKDPAARPDTWTLTISNFIKNASQKQLEQARSILNSFRDMEF